MVNSKSSSEGSL